MIAFLDNNLRHHEGVAAVRPCDGLGPAAVVKELPAGCVGVVDAPVDLERLAGIRVFRLFAVLAAELIHSPDGVERNTALLSQVGEGAVVERDFIAGMEGHRAIRRQGPAVQHPTVQVFTRKHIAKNGVGRIVGDIGVSLRIPLAIIEALAIVVIDHIVGFARGLEGHSAAGALGNFPAAVIDQLHSGGGAAAVLMRHAALIGKGSHVGLGQDGNGAGIARAGHTVAVLQEAGKGRAMFGCHGLALDEDVNEVVQLIHGGVSGGRGQIVVLSIEYHN